MSLEWSAFREFKLWCENHVGEQVTVLDETFVVVRRTNGLIYLDPEEKA